MGLCGKEFTGFPVNDDIRDALAIARGGARVGRLRARGHHRRGGQDAVARAVCAQAHLRIRNLWLGQRAKYYERMKCQSQTAHGRMP